VTQFRHLVALFSVMWFASSCATSSGLNNETLWDQVNQRARVLQCGPYYQRPIQGAHEIVAVVVGRARSAEVVQTSEYERHGSYELTVESVLFGIDVPQTLTLAFDFDNSFGHGRGHDVPRTPHLLYLRASPTGGYAVLAAYSCSIGAYDD
jgi:hypothetical protein